MEEALPLPQPELPLCDSLIIWVSARGPWGWGLAALGEPAEELGATWPRPLRTLRASGRL
jgi:hypothetical protein